MAATIREGFNFTLSDFNDISSLSVSPVIDGSSVTKTSGSKKISSKGTTVTADKTSLSFNQRYEKQTDTADVATKGVLKKGVSFIQNVYSPKQLSRTEIRRDTKQLIELATSKF